MIRAAVSSPTLSSTARYHFRILVSRSVIISTSNHNFSTPSDLITNNHYYYNEINRCYTTSSPLLKDDNNNNNNNNQKHKSLEEEEEEEEEDEIQCINTEDLSQSEIEKLMNDAITEVEAEEEAKERLRFIPEHLRNERLRYGKRKPRDFETFIHLKDLERHLEEDGEEEEERIWTHRDKRCGMLGIKLGMMPIWDDWGERHACTVLFMDRNKVIRVKKKHPWKKQSYNAVEVCAGERRAKNVSKTVLGHYHKHGLDIEHPPWIVREFRVHRDVDDQNGNSVFPEPGTELHARHFIPGQNVDVSGISKGKGFQGGMKRWNFKGMPATHGTSLSHRAIGSTGQCQNPGKVFKGKKMPGHMGVDRVTVQNLRVMKIDRGRDLIYVKGCVPGNKGEFVEVRDAVKRPLFGTDMVEGGVEETLVPPLPTFQYEEGVDGCGEGGFEVFMPVNKIDPLAPVEDEGVVYTL